MPGKKTLSHLNIQCYQQKSQIHLLYTLDQSGNKHLGEIDELYKTSTEISSAPANRRTSKKQKEKVEIWLIWASNSSHTQTLTDRQRTGDKGEKVTLDYWTAVRLQASAAQ